MIYNTNWSIIILEEINSRDESLFVCVLRTYTQIATQMNEGPTKWMNEWMESILRISRSIDSNFNKHFCWTEYVVHLLDMLLWLWLWLLLRWIVAALLRLMMICEVQKFVILDDVLWCERWWMRMISYLPVALMLTLNFEFIQSEI